jgi:hypothetical protein
MIEYDVEWDLYGLYVAVKYRREVSPSVSVKIEDTLAQASVETNKSERCK